MFLRRLRYMTYNQIKRKWNRRLFLFNNENDTPPSPPATDAIQQWPEICNSLFKLRKYHTIAATLWCHIVIISVSVHHLSFEFLSTILNKRLKSPASAAYILVCVLFYPIRSLAVERCRWHFQLCFVFRHPRNSTANNCWHFPRLCTVWCLLLLQSRCHFAI